MLKIYKASAGSGKTHTLTRDYILLAFDKPHYFMNILAVTFTNKAAGEMKNRIIEQLFILSNNPKKSDYLNDIKNKFNFNTKLIKNNALKLLKYILHNYTFFNISTIDSFVQKIIRSFSFELQIPSSYNLEMDVDKVVKDLTDELISKIDENKKLQKWLTYYAFDRISNSEKWDFRKNLIDFSKQLFQEDFYSKFDKINTSKQSLNENITSLLESCNKIIYSYKNFFDEKFSKGIEIIQKSNIESLNIRKIQYLLNIFLNYDYDLKINKTLNKAIENNNWWNDKISDKIKSQLQSTIDKLKNILEKLFSYKEKNGKNYYSALLIKKNIYDFGILNDVNNLLPDYRAKNNFLIISDLSILLKKLIGNNDAPFIYEKIGNKLKNIMIDEFQDTSEFQWFNFKPLINNSLALNNYNLIVGDLKQSIYRWRNGNWELLQYRIKNEIPNNFIKEVNLDTNWRSNKEIVEFNNSLFSVLPKIMQNKANEEISNCDFYEGIDDIIRESYKKVDQKVAKKNNKNGFIKLKFYKKNDWKDLVNQEIPELISDLLKKYNPGDIAILVRTNNEANEIMQILLDSIAKEQDENKKYNVLSAESLLLTNSMGVRILIKALKFILNQNQTIHLIEIITDYKRLNNEKINDDLFKNSKNLEDIKKYLPEKFFESLSEFINYSLFELVEKLVSIFKLDKFSSEIPFIRSFQEKISEFISRFGSDIAGFLEFWTEKAHSFSVELSEVKDAIQIMTVHKAKGLSFPVVILPYINWKLKSSHNTILWTNTKNTPFEKTPFIPLNFNNDMKYSHFQKTYSKELIYSFMDNLNILYVAFTRAKNSIYGFSKITNKITGNTISDNLFIALKNNDKLKNNKLKNLSQFLNTKNFIFEMGEEKEDKKLYQDDKTDEKTEILKLTEYPAHDWTDNIAIISHSEDLIAETVETRRNAIKHGIIMHDILNNIQNPDNVDKIVKKYAEKGKLSEFDVNEILNDFKRIFNNIEVKNWFNSSWKVFSEKEILTKYGITKIPDRVISNHKEIKVIDYKFGNKRSEHKWQVKYYIKLLKEIYPDKKIKGYLYYATNDEITTVS